MSPLPGDGPCVPTSLSEELDYQTRLRAETKLRAERLLGDGAPEPPEWWSDLVSKSLRTNAARREGECRAFLRFLSVATGVDEVSITATEAARPGRGQISFTVPPAPASPLVASGGYCAPIIGLDRHIPFPLIGLDRHIPFPHVAVRKGGIKYDVSSYDLSMELCDPAKDNIWRKRLPRAARIWWGGRRPVSAYRRTKRRITDVRNVWAGRTVSADPGDLY